MSQSKAPVWIARLLIWGYMVFALSPCWMIIAVLIGVIAIPQWQQFCTESSLPIFPDSERVFDIFDYCCDNESGVKALYYWTQAPIESVRSYYEEITAPFIDNRTNISVDRSSVRETETGYETCYFHKYGCVEIRLYDFGPDDPVMLPNMMNINFDSIGAMYRGPTMTPYPSDHRGGTIIVFSYYTQEM
jgi:hypothetical protein